MMIWDEVARIVEAKEAAGITSSDVKTVMQRSHLFVIDDAPQNFIPKSYTPEQCAFYQLNFFLPFRRIAIEDKCSLILLYDVEKHQRGLDVERHWVEFLPAATDRNRNDFREGNKELGIPESDLFDSKNDFTRDLILMTVGVIKTIEFKPGEKCYIDGRVISCSLINKTNPTDGGIQIDYRTEEGLRVYKAGLKNALQAIHEVAYFNDPSNFILEEIPASYERRKNSKGARKRIQRACDRPRYTVLKPTQIRKRMHLPEPSMPSGVKRRPHERRAHLRTYPDDAKRWPRVHGQTVTVKESWIGPKESVVNGKRYRVLTDIRPKGEESCTVAATGAKR